ncbi:MAG: hypothetical protein F6K23_09535 [Okeania sp. SIO2C9]|uniref:hypothetical protein n=1 Tax=Okeania sp. SIO2C9 TaxID=2607791 RepID=UPI0013BF4210|nr:hypothetical protein [Okeania sp. SIO2C9]NEQ73289.1 hypothetical protein [Okeania sp. SIO2C9]
MLPDLILIIRDPYNTFASLIKKKEKRLSKNPDAIINKWIEHAREYLGLSNYLQNQINISYNEWFINKAYRQKITEALELVFTDAGINTAVFIWVDHSKDVPWNVPTGFCL